MNFYEIAIPDKKKPPVLKFPARCVNCGKPKETVLPLKLNMGMQKRGQVVLMDLPVPLCKECGKMERKITYVTLVPFVISGTIFFILVFIPVWLVSPQGTSTQTLALPVILGASAGLVAGLVGGTFVEFVLKFMFVPVYGRLLMKRPLTIFGVFTDSEDTPGLSARFTKGKRSLMLIFENDEIAREFINLNPH